MPVRKWQEAQGDPQGYIEAVIRRIVEDDHLVLRTSRVTDKGSSMMATIKVRPDLTNIILASVDRHHLFARMTMRNDGKDEANKPIWMPLATESNLLSYTRELREKGMRVAGKAYRGLSMRYLKHRQGLQVGVRVETDFEPSVRRQLLPENLLPAEEAREVVGRRVFRVFGMPPNLTKHSCSSQLHRNLDWAVIPLREVYKPNASTVTWVVAADASPRDWRFFADFGSIGCRVIAIEEEKPKEVPNRMLVPNRWNTGQVTGPRHFNPYAFEQDDESMGDQDEPNDGGSAADGVNSYEENGRDTAFESAQESCDDNAWSKVVRSTRRKGSHGKGKPTGDSPTLDVRTPEIGTAQRASAAVPPRPQTFDMGAGEASRPADMEKVVHMIEAMQAQLAQTQQLQAQMAQQLMQLNQRQQKTDETIAATNQAMLTQVLGLRKECAHLANMANLHSLRVGVIEKHLNLPTSEQGLGHAELEAVEEPSHEVAAGAAVAAADVTVLMEDATDKSQGRGRKGTRGSSPAGRERSREVRPRVKKAGPENSEGSASAEEKKESS